MRLHELPIPLTRLSTRARLFEEAWVVLIALAIAGVVVGLLGAR